MKTELLPILVAYLGQKCSYELGYAKFNLKFGYPEIHHLGALENFKLHLRKPQSITNEELRTLSGIVCGIECEPEPYSHRGGIVVKDIEGDEIVIVNGNGVIELGSYYGHRFAETTNYLRSIGICVDEVLVEEGLVQFDGEEVEPCIS